MGQYGETIKLHVAYCIVFQVIRNLRHPNTLKCLTCIPGMSGDSFVTQYAVGTGYRVKAWTVPKAGLDISSSRYVKALQPFVYRRYMAVVMDMHCIAKF